jgi:predicted component of type VI protein secretion system
MPVTLIVRAKGEASLPPVAFEGPRIVIGRGSSCELRLPDPSVSGRHASIRAQGAAWVLVDEGSTNGTRLNGEKLAVQAPRRIETGDLITVGRIELVVKLGAAPPSSVERTRELALALVARGLGDEGASRISIRVDDGPDAGATLELGGDSARTIGRDPRCALRLTDRAIPPIALEVSLDAGRPRVSLRDPRCEAALAGKALVVGPKVPWADGAILSLGTTRLVLEDPIARALDRSSLGDDEPIAALPPPAEEPVPPPPAVVEPVAPEPAEAEVARAEPRPRPAYDRRRSWRGATTAFEIVALVIGLAVFAGSIAGLYWLLRR